MATEQVLAALPPQRPNNIFLMEFVVDDLQLWQLPDDCIDCDPASIQFRFLDSVNVEIDDSEVGSQCKANGKNCLFTLADRPTAEHPVHIAVFKRPGQDEAAILAGKAQIAIDEAFANLFRVCIPESCEKPAATESCLCLEDEQAAAAKVAFPVSEVYKAWYPLLSVPPPKSSTSNAQLDAQRTTSQTSQPAQDVIVGVVCVRLRITCFGTTIVSPFQYNKRKQQCAIENDKYTIPCDDIFLAADACTCSKSEEKSGGRGRSRKHATNKRNNQLQNLMKTCNATTYRAQQELSNICGQLQPATNQARPPVPSVQQPVTPPLPSVQRKPADDGPVITSVPTSSSPSAAMILNPTDELGTGDESQPPMTTDSWPPAPAASKTELDAEQPQFDEFCTEINENALIVRVAKNTRTVCRVGGGDPDDADAEERPESRWPPVPQCEACQGQSQPQGCVPVPHLPHRRPPSPKRYAMTCTDDGNDMNFQVPSPAQRTGFKYINSLGLPIIRGNRKYPAGFETNFKLPQCASLTPAYRPMKSDPRNCCMKCAEQLADYGGAALCPEGIEVCKKPSANPNYDVFVLKLAPTDANPEDHIELELRTPKSPTAPAFMETQFAQTYEEDFSEKYTGGAGKKGGGGGGKKGEEKAEKGGEKKEKKEKKKGK